MRNLILIIITIIFTASSCQEDPEMLTLNDLEDMTEYTEYMLIDCSKYKGHSVSKLMVNYGRHEPTEDLELSESGYYRLEISYNKSTSDNPDVIRIVILDEERGYAEWGLKKWVPRPATKQKELEKLTVIHPTIIPEGVNIPVILLAGDTINHYPVNSTITAGDKTVNMKRGVGSFQVNSTDANGTKVSIGSIEYTISGTAVGNNPLLLSDTVKEDLIISENSLISIPEDLTIDNGVTVTFNQGVFVKIGAGVNIYNEGKIIVSGTRESPVTMTCSEPDKYWGGILSTGSGNEITATYGIFNQSGYHDGEGYKWGHAKRQALFYMNNGTLSVDHCYMTDHIGQIFYPVNSNITIDRCIIQRAKTGGQINYCELEVKSSVFTDFPDDTDQYRDEDNDALYLVATNAYINRTSFMYAKDDGLDSGGNEGGEVFVSDCRFEANYHEGAALSSANEAIKHHVFTNCVFTNCGQGLELGFSGPNHMVTVDSCEFLKNNIGIRYGDNYLFGKAGKIEVSNSYSLDNIDYDVWNMIRSTWEPDVEKMVFNNVVVSKEYPVYPELIINE